jgi:proteasome lid subunit RPN8/RPN11
MSFNVHEVVYRGPALLQRLRQSRIAVCGAGALGANLVEQLARMGAQELSVVDRDRVEEQNLATQPFSRSELGLQKAVALAHALYRSLGCEVKASAAELNPDTVGRLLRGAELVVDCLDNRAGRLCLQSYCRQRLKAEARRSGPNECVGFLLSEATEVPPVPRSFFALRNVARDPRCSFALDPSQVAEALHARLPIVGLYHSHPHGDLVPSFRDHQGWLQLGWLYWVVNSQAATFWRWAEHGFVPL